MLDSTVVCRRALGCEWGVLAIAEVGRIERRPIVGEMLQTTPE